MHYHHQNLTDGRFPLWRHGRSWWGPWNWEWHVFHHPRFRLGVEKGGYDDSRIAVTVALFLFSLHVSRSFRRHFEDRELTLYWFEGSLWLKLWADDEWHRDRPWHRNMIVFHVREWFTGRPKCVTTKGDPVPCVVPMPEGSYPAVATPETRVWTYRFGVTRTREDWWLDIPDGGIPHSGKGENSWDCGDDALCGIGGDTLETAIGNAVASSLKSRRRYGYTAETRGRVVYARPNNGHSTEIING